MEEHIQSSSCCVALTLPQELWEHILSYSTVQDLIRVETVSRFFRSLDTSSHWRKLCETHWPHYLQVQARNGIVDAVTSPTAESTTDTISITDSQNGPVLPPLNFGKRRYRSIAQDLQRTELIPSELEGLTWVIHYYELSPLRTINDQGSFSTRCYFVGNRLYLLENLLEFELLDVGTPMSPNMDSALAISNLLMEYRQPKHLDEALHLANRDHWDAVASTIGGSTNQNSSTTGGGDGSSSRDNQDHSQHQQSENIDEKTKCPPMTAASLNFSFRQCVRIADFTLFTVARLPNGGWLIWNKMVALVSVGVRMEPGALPETLRDHFEMLRMFAGIDALLE
eukprot:Nitzschia sp. Nitz4//scaffold313_size41840//33270//34286//NITZ4_007440-RA/size41840-processed-gene-0.15-mRNA-1//-1//CDS//3329547442//2489//frame0